MSSQEEVDQAAEFLRTSRVPFALLHTNSTYPAPLEELNLRYISSLRERYGVPVGYSGHERGYLPTLAAVALGACVVERHLSFDRTSEGPDHAASLEPDEFTGMVRDIRAVEASLGRSEKGFSRGEILNRETLGKSLVAAADIERGAVIRREMVTAKSPGKGLSPLRLHDLVGRVATRAIRRDEWFREEDAGGTRASVEVPRYDSLWGLKGRFHEFDDLLPFEPRLIEFHLSDKDLHFDPRAAWGSRRFTQRLVFHAPEYIFRRMVDLCALDPAHRRHSIDVMQRTLDLLRQTGQHFQGEPTVVVHPGGMSVEPAGDRERMVENALDSISKLDYRGARFLPENLPPQPWYFAGQYFQIAMADVEDVLRICETFGLRMCLDTSHAKLYCNAAGVRFDDFVLRARDHVAHLHISDAAGVDKEGLQIGDGEIDFEAALRPFEGREFSWVPEIWRGHLDHYLGFRTALARLARFPALSPTGAAVG
jgi:N-acetylneuraminate synthase